MAVESSSEASFQDFKKRKIHSTLRKWGWITVAEDFDAGTRIEGLAGAEWRVWPSGNFRGYL